MYTWMCVLVARREQISENFRSEMVSISHIFSSNLVISKLFRYQFLKLRSKIYNYLMTITTNTTQSPPPDTEKKNQNGYHKPPHFNP